MSDPFRFLCAQRAIGFEKFLPVRCNQRRRDIHAVLINEDVDELSCLQSWRVGVCLACGDLSLDRLARLKRANVPLVLR